MEDRGVEDAVSVETLCNLAGFRGSVSQAVLEHRLFLSHLRRLTDEFRAGLRQLALFSGELHLL